MEKISPTVVENLSSKLKMLGLSTYAAKTYLALVSKPSASAGLLCTETGIPDSKMYYALSELQKKGLIITQSGTPNMYKALHPKEAIGSLKQQLNEELTQKTSQADSLADSLAPLFESVEGKEEIELAYVIRGKKNIVKKMRDLIDSAKREAVVYISEKELLQELTPTIKNARKRVQVKLALLRKLAKTANLEFDDHVKMLKCRCNMVIADMKTLITISGGGDGIAIMTNDKALITMSREYYENPSCCPEKS